MVSKHFKHLVILVLAGLAGCTGNKPTAAKTDSITTPKTTATSASDKDQIQNLIRKMLKWSEGKNLVGDLLPAIENKTDSTFVGFDLNKADLTARKMDSTKFFSSAFTDNYKHIIVALDKKLRAGKFGKWSTGDLPVFGFDNDVDPWCMCQDVPYDKPDPWDNVEVKIIRLENNRADCVWKWGKPEINGGNGWDDMSYKFSAEKINGEWKISYLQGFDYNEGIKGDTN